MPYESNEICKKTRFFVWLEICFPIQAASIQNKDAGETLRLKKDRSREGFKHGVIVKKILTFNEKILDFLKKNGKIVVSEIPKIYKEVTFMPVKEMTSIISYIRDFVLGIIKLWREFYSFATYYVKDPFPAEEDPGLTF